MSQHPALSPGRSAVVTGAASGIGLAAARRFAALGMNVCLADHPGETLDEAVYQVEEAAREAGQKGTVIGEGVDVSRLEDVERLRTRVEHEFGDVAVLMNNAGINRGGGAWQHIDRWQALIDVNLWGVIHGVQTFAPLMIEQPRPSLIINTGSKQGITNPPGDTAYNVTKAGVKALTEALAHELRNTEGAQASAHLLVPGFTYTGMSVARHPENPPEAWSAEQVVERLEQALAAGDFYVICPDNAVDEQTDRRRIAWSAGDMIHNRPALSRWHPDYQAAFEAFVRGESNPP